MFNISQISVVCNAFIGLQTFNNTAPPHTHAHKQRLNLSMNHCIILAQLVLHTITFVRGNGVGAGGKWRSEITWQNIVNSQMHLGSQHNSVFNIELSNWNFICNVLTYSFTYIGSLPAVVYVLSSAYQHTLLALDGENSRFLNIFQKTHP